MDTGGPQDRLRLWKASAGVAFPGELPRLWPVGFRRYGAPRRRFAVARGAAVVENARSRGHCPPGMTNHRPTGVELGGKQMLMRFAAALMLVAGVAVPAKADPVEDFYKGKTITMIVSYGPGGGYDTYGRILAQHMSKYIPGHPTIIINNMPGAGSLKGANYIYNVAPKDGTAFGIFARNIPLLALLDKTDQNVQFDPTKFTWIGSSSSGENDAYVLISRKDAKNKNIED